MDIYYRILRGERMPRKLKKRIKKMPVGSYCYGTAIGDKGKMIHGKRHRVTVCCPYHKLVSIATEEKDAVAYLGSIPVFSGRIP